MTKSILLSLFAVLFLTSCGFSRQQKELFHKIRYTASSVELVEWNTTDTINAAFVKETIDNTGRTKELKFYNHNHQLDWAGSGFYGGPLIKYDYDNDKIIETFYSDENEIANDFKTSEVPYRHIYILNQENQITDLKQIYKIDFEWTKDSFEETIEHLNLYKGYPDEGSDLIKVFGYSYSYAKMNGIDPERKK